MANHFPKLMLLLSMIFILSVVPVLGETATYSATFEAPLCTSGDYTSGSPCSTASLLSNRFTSEPNYYNSIDEAYEQSAGFSLSTYSVEQIVAWDTDGDGQLETGDTVQIQFDGNCPEGDDLGLSLWYSLNPELGNSATWTKIDSVDYDPADVCIAGDYFDETVSAGGFTARTFTITGSPNYVAIRMSVDRDGTADITYGGTARPFDVDDLVLAMYDPPTPPTIDTISATAGQTNVTLESDFTYNDATEIEAYWVIDQVNQTSTNYTVGTSHDVTYTGLTAETTYDYELCIISDLSATPICSGESTFTTTNRTPPYINIAGAFDVGITTASVGGTFFFEDFTNITAYAKLDGVNQTQTLYASGVSQYDKEDFTGLDPVTTYTWDWCISYENGEICEGGGNFTTLDYTPPYVNAISDFNITNHQAILGATVFYGSYENMTLEFFLDDVGKGTTDFDYDGFDPSEYLTESLDYLDFATTYDYRLDIIYIDPNTFAGASDTNWLDGYRVTNGGGSTTYQIAFWDGRIAPDVNWTALNDRRVTSSDECAELCNRFYGDPNLNTGQITEGLGTCWYIDNSPYDECFIGSDGSYLEYNAGTTGTWFSQEMNQSVDIPRLITGTTYDFTTLDAYIPYISISGATDIRGTTATLVGTVFPKDYYNVQPWFEFDGVRYNSTLINRTPEYNETLYSQSEHPSYDLTGLSMNTTYNYTFCVDYDWNGTQYTERVCDIQRSMTTSIEPTFAWGTVDITMADSLTWDFSWDFNGVYEVEYRFNGTGSWLSASDGVTKTQGFSGLEPETNYTAYVEYRYTVELGDDEIYVNSSTNTARTYYENAFDDVWDTLLQGSGTAKTLLGFVVLFGIIFLGVGIFGKYNMRMGLLPIMLFVVIGTAIATLMKLFSVGILLLVIVGAIVLAILTGMFKNHDEGGR